LSIPNKVYGDDDDDDDGGGGGDILVLGVHSGYIYMQHVSISLTKKC